MFSAIFHLIPSCVLQCPGLDSSVVVHLIGQFIVVRPWPNMLVISRTGLLGSRLGVGFNISPLKTGLWLMDSPVIRLELTAIALDCPSITQVIVGRH
jgi:hypothetical protein